MWVRKQLLGAAKIRCSFIKAEFIEGGKKKVVQTGFTRLWGKLSWGNRITLLKPGRDGRWQAFDRNVVVISCHVIPAGPENSNFFHKKPFTSCSGVSVALKLLRTSWISTGCVLQTSVTYLFLQGVLLLAIPCFYLQSALCFGGVQGCLLKRRLRFRATCCVCGHHLFLLNTSLRRVVCCLACRLDEAPWEACWDASLTASTCKRGVSVGSLARQNMRRNAVL